MQGTKYWFDVISAPTILSQIPRFSRIPKTDIFAVMYPGMYLPVEL